MFLSLKSCGRFLSSIVLLVDAFGKKPLYSSSLPFGVCCLGAIWRAYLSLLSIRSTPGVQGLGEIGLIWDIRIHVWIFSQLILVWFLGPGEKLFGGLLFPLYGGFVGEEQKNFDDIEEHVIECWGSNIRVALWAQNHNNFRNLFSSRSVRDGVHEFFCFPFVLFRNGHLIHFL